MEQALSALSPVSVASSASISLALSALSLHTCADIIYTIHVQFLTNISCLAGNTLPPATAKANQDLSSTATDDPTTPLHLKDDENAMLCDKYLDIRSVQSCDLFFTYFLLNRILL